MLTKITLYIGRAWALVKAHWILSLVAALVVAGGVWWFVAANTDETYQLVPVSKGAIVETVSVTGSTAPVESVSLGFQNSGTIARVYRKVGDRVSAGETLAELNTASLSAALQQARAVYRAALASRSSASLPEVVADARNTYRSAYTTLDGVLQNDVDTFFGDPTAYGPSLLISATMYDYGELSRGRAALDDTMQDYQKTLATVAGADPATLLTKANTVAQSVSQFLNKLAVAANADDSQATSAQLTALATARATTDALLASLSTARDALRTGTVGATSLADADVEKAAAGVAVAEANLVGTRIVAPISGVVTQFDAKVGQTASPSVSLVSLISAQSFEITAGVPETDIGKVAVGNKVQITLDAFPGEVFTGTVFYVEPAETVTQGVVEYKTKVAFDTSSLRMKSGLTANLDIETRRKEVALLLPQYAILQNDAGTFVKILREGVAVEVPVALGIQDKDGNVEILSGIAEGEQVLNIGLKQ
ncbi:MAG: efflux RND transporter periplasmic adaptor subunit [Candidatus Paceibacterota bacterium]